MQFHECLSNIKSPTRTGCLLAALAFTSFLSGMLCSLKWQSLVLLLPNILRILFDNNANIFLFLEFVWAFFVASVKNTISFRVWQHGCWHRCPEEQESAEVDQWLQIACLSILLNFPFLTPLFSSRKSCLLKQAPPLLPAAPSFPSSPH